MCVPGMFVRVSWQKLTLACPIWFCPIPSIAAFHLCLMVPIREPESSGTNVIGCVTKRCQIERQGSVEHFMGLRAVNLCKKQIIYLLTLLLLDKIRKDNITFISGPLAHSIHHKIHKTQYIKQSIVVKR